MKHTSDPGFDAGSYVDELGRLQAEVDRFHTWQGLMSLLDEHYPPEVFDGSSGDEGPRVVALVRAVDAERSSRQVWAEEALATRRLVAGNKSLDWLLAFGEDHDALPRVCVCVTDEQAAQLAPGFSRPVCAVHPEGGGADV